MILLTSPSPRRRELLKQIGFQSDIDYMQIDMPINKDFHRDHPLLTLEQAEELLIEVSRLKVIRAIEERRAVREQSMSIEKTVVVGATTVVFFNGRVLGRPLFNVGRPFNDQGLRQAQEEAKRMLREIRGQQFQVMTSVVMARGENITDLRSRCVTTNARMKMFDDEEIKRYIQTNEPLDKAGGFGIQERGVALFESIEGSYSNVVGLPLREFYEMLHDPLFVDCVQFKLDQKTANADNLPYKGTPEMSAVSMGDINYDISCAELPEGFFSLTLPPGDHLHYAINRTIGGAGVNFALHAKDAGFKPCWILGVIAGDELGKYIEQELHKQGIQTMLPMDYDGRKTSIAIMLRDTAQEDTLISLIDSDQSLSVNEVSLARLRIESASVLYVTGYCLIDEMVNGKLQSRKAAALKAMEWAKNAGVLVILDIPAKMYESVPFDELINMTSGKVDVFVVENLTMLHWLLPNEPVLHKDDDWKSIEAFAREQLLPYYPALFMRDSRYTHEMIITPGSTYGPYPLNYRQLSALKKIGYGDWLTADRLKRLMAPRILLASESPRRLELLRQIVAKNKIQIEVSGNPEIHRNGEPPIERVRRLAEEKAQAAWQIFLALHTGSDSNHIEVVIGADTEITLDGEVVGHPTNEDEARTILRRLSGREHTAITGMALIKTATGEKIVTDVHTKVKFKQLTPSEIDQYVESGEPIGKAGAYNIHGKGGLFVERIQGSYSNVVGLPLECLSDELRQLGMPIWDIDKVSNWNFTEKDLRALNGDPDEARL